MESAEQDERLRNAVLLALAQDECTNGLEIRVGVLNAIVHLAGQAPSLEIWHYAGQMAAQVSQVRGVVNRIAAPGAPEPARTIHLDLKPIGDAQQTAWEDGE